MTRRQRLVLGRLFDWRFAAVMVVVVGFAYFVFVGVSAVQDSRSAREETAAARAEAETARVAAAGERDKLLATQAKLLALYRDLDRRQAATLAYLRAHGIRLPADYDAPAKTSRFSPPASSSSSPSTSRPRDQAQTSKPRAPKPRTTKPAAQPAPKPPAPKPAPSTPEPDRGLVGDVLDLLTP